MHSFYKNNFLEHETRFCSKFKNKLNTMPSLGSKINQKQAIGSKISQKQAKIQIKETKLNFVPIQNDRILVIFFCLQAKLQLFQEAVVRKKLAFFKLNDCQKILRCCQAGKKSLL